eukprot:gene50575-16525_t
MGRVLELGALPRPVQAPADGIVLDAGITEKQANTQERGFCMWP